MSNSEENIIKVTFTATLWWKLEKNELVNLIANYKNSF